MAAVTLGSKAVGSIVKIKVLKNSTLNNMVNNVFLVSFPDVDSVAIQSGIYDPAGRKIYV